MNRLPVYLNHLGLICALGDDHQTIRNKLFTKSDSSHLSLTDGYSVGRTLPLGAVNTPLPEIQSDSLIEHTRTNQLMAAAMGQIQAAFDTAREGVDPLRIGIILGTSTSGIAEGERAIANAPAPAEGEKHQMPDNFDYQQQEMANPAIALANWLGTQGPAYVVSTACSSSAKALASARRLLRMGICDLVIAGGVDSLCKLTVNGFSALESVSEQPCNPFSVNRNGINIGEGAALFILSREPGPVCLSGVGEGSDAHHISAPHPEGKGAANAMRLALEDAGLSRNAIDYLNLHGTATPQNDRMESLAVAEVMGCDLPCSSTKPHTGHTLGAAGAIEAAVCWLTLTNEASNELPLHNWDGQLDSDVAPINLINANTTMTNTVDQTQPIKTAMSNSFAFGGNNISLILERTQ